MQSETAVQSGAQGVSDGVALHAPFATTEVVLEAQGIAKSFPGVRVLQNVDFELRAGEVHALCGENGAGKSTLMKILAGNLQPDAGSIYVRGRAVNFSSPLAAKRQGVLLVHQEISLVPELTVADNLFLGNLPKQSFGRLDTRKLHQAASSVLNDCGYEFSPTDIVGELSIAQQQMVEIARACAFQCSAVVFDEPTASLTEQEAERLFATIRRLKEKGVGIVYISHRMNEIFRLADRITVLRDGQVRATLERTATDPAEITRLMIGRSLDHYFERARSTPGEELLRLEGVSVLGAVNSVSFAIRSGEVLGLYGLVGAGRSELAEAIFGLRPRSAGALHWSGTRISIRSARDAVDLGIALVPEDRKLQGLILSMAGQSNVTLAVWRRLSNILGFRKPRKERQLFFDFRDRLKIKISSPATLVNTLSGGNQQKIMLAKWLATTPSLLILDEPTRGIDVGAKAEIHSLISRLAEEGMAILLVSSEMPEIMGLSHRILTMYKGSITGEFDAQSITEDALIRHVMPSQA